MAKELEAPIVGPPISEENVLDYGWKMFEHLTGQIQNAVTKASLILGVDAILIGALAALVAQRITTLPAHLYAVADVISVILLGFSLLLLGASIYFALVATRPSMKRARNGGLFFFGMIRTLSLDKFIDKFENLTPLQVQRDLLTQVHTLAGIAQRKFRRNAIALNFLLATLYLWALAKILTVLG